MKPGFRSLRAQFIIMVALVSSVGMVSSILIVNTNYKHSIDETRRATLELVEQETETLTTRHTELLAEFGLRIQNDPTFKSAISQNNQPLIQELLDDNFAQYYVGADVLEINKIYAFDIEYSRIAESSVGEDFHADTPFCPMLPERAAGRQGPERLKLAQSFCNYHNHALNSVIVPIGTLSPIGYLQIISRPYNLLKATEEKLGLPLRIETTRGQIDYQSGMWPTNPDNHIFINHDISDIHGTPAISVVMAKDISGLMHSLNQSRSLIVLLVGIATLTGIALFYFRFERLLIRPLNRLGQQLSLIEHDEDQLGSALSLEGSPEIRSLTGKFNKLSCKLADMYGALEKLAYRDQLTGLPNRFKLQDLMDCYTESNRRYGTPFCLIVLGLDRFKTVNDTMGHNAGDQLLKQVSERLRTVLREHSQQESIAPATVSTEKNELVTRLSGDEFAALLPSVGDTETATVIAENILSSFCEPFVVGSFNFNLGVSIGVVLCPQHGDTTADLMQHADLAMHHAKENQIGFALYQNELKEHGRNLLRIDTELRKAIQNDSLSLAFQPKINLESNRVVAVEVLLRWIHEEMGFIPPDKFIDVAEQTGLIVDVTQWVIRNALKQKSEWDKQDIHLSIAINLSAKNLWDKQLMAFIRNELKTYSIMPQTVTLELTETAVMNDPAYAIIVLRQLRGLGLNVSIDDFGTGYSSLNYLKQLPINEIKIDRSFVMNMENDENDAVIVRSTIDLAHNMGLSVVAEGVESDTALNHLKTHSCDLAQGFHMAKPLFNEELLEWIKTSPWGLG